jgi:hypothetical protein
MKLTYEELEVLVKRNYPDYPELKPTGLCSKHHRDIDVNCSICFPSWYELTKAHCDLKLKAWEKLKEANIPIYYGYWRVANHQNLS